MIASWALFPLAVQAVFVVCAALPLRRLFVAKASDQHTVSNHVLAVAAHAAMLVWSQVYAGQVGLVYSAIIGGVVSAATLGVVLYYRAFPGGRASGARGRFLRGRPPAAS